MCLLYFFFFNGLILFFAGCFLRTVKNVSIPEASDIYCYNLNINVSTYGADFDKGFVKETREAITNLNFARFLWSLFNECTWLNISWLLLVND